MSDKYEDPNIEKYVLSAFLRGPEFWKVIPDVWFKDPLCNKAYRIFREFHSKERAFPTFVSIESYIKEPEMKLFVVELSTIEVSPLDLAPFLKSLYRMHVSRELLDDATNLSKDIDRYSVEEILKKKITKFTQLTNPLNVGDTVRRHIFDNTRERMLSYRQTESHLESSPSTSYGISKLDFHTGGAFPGEMTLVVGGTSGYKTKTLINFAYNFSFISEVDTMVVTLEVPINKYEQYFDSRHSGLLFDKIRSGGLGIEGDIYRGKLIDITDKKYPLYVVDIPGGSTSADLVGELELYYATYGKYPKILIVDYANQMAPAGRWEDKSDKLKVLGEEFRQIVRSYRIHLVTASQENREGQKKKIKEDLGLEHIGESHYFSNAFNTIIHLWQSSDGADKASNVLNFKLDKNRDGEKDVSFPVNCLPEVNYIGDINIL